MQHVYLYAIPDTLHAGLIDLLAAYDASEVLPLCLPVVFFFHCPYER